MQWNGASSFEFDWKSMETETTTWSVFSNGDKYILEEILASEKVNPKDQDCENYSKGSK